MKLTVSLGGADTIKSVRSVWLCTLFYTQGTEGFQNARRGSSTAGRQAGIAAAYVSNMFMEVGGDRHWWE